MRRSGWRLQRLMPLAILAALGDGLFVNLAGVIAAPPETAVRDAASADVDGSTGLRLAQDRQVDQWLESARGHVERQEFALASGLLARVFSSGEESFTTHGTGTMLARDEAWRLAKRLPDEIGVRLEADLDRAASDVWVIVRASDSRDEIAAFAVRHRFSTFGLEALRTLAAARRDASQHESSAAAWARVAEHPRATMVQRTAARLALAPGRPSAWVNLVKMLGSYRDRPPFCVPNQTAPSGAMLMVETRPLARPSLTVKLMKFVPSKRETPTSVAAQTFPSAVGSL